MDIKNKEIASTESPDQTEFDPKQGTKEIMQDAVRHLQNPEATTLDYQPRTIFPETTQGMTRFIMLKASEGGALGKQYGISIAANFDRSLGFTLAQTVRGEKSTREVTITVFEQSLKDKLARKATVRRLQVSGDLDSITATHFMAGNQEKFDVDRWNSGYNALMQADVLFHKSSNIKEGQAEDLKLVHRLLKKAKFDPKMQEKVKKSEDHFNLATVVDKGLESLQQAKPQSALPQPK